MAQTIGSESSCFCLQASISLRRINLTQASKADKVKQKIAVNNCLHANIQALTALFMMSWGMVREQAKIWGVGLYFAHRKVKIPKLTELEEETFTDLPPDELQAIGVAKTMLTQATLKPTEEEHPEPKKPSLSNKQVDEMHKASEEIEEAKKTLEKVLVSEEEEKMECWDTEEEENSRRRGSSSY